MFMSGFEVDVLTPKKIPKSKSNTPRKKKESGAEPVVDHEEELQPMVEPMKLEVEQMRDIVVPKQSANSS